MEELNLAKELKKDVDNEIENMAMIIYGSTVFGVKTSDLDICFIRENDLFINELEKLKDIIRMFHVKNNLRIDEEVPYDNKLIYTNSFIENTFSDLPFPYINGKYIIPAIEKTYEFLSSIEMKKRLILNILTTKHIVVDGNQELISKYSNDAWESILKVVVSYSGRYQFTLQELVEWLYADPFNKIDGEMYLGYKTNLREKMLYINYMVEQQLIRLEKENKIQRVLKRTYSPNENWLSK